jgi:hypothetical protein
LLLLLPLLFCAAHAAAQRRTAVTLFSPPPVAVNVLSPRYESAQGSGATMAAAPKGSGRWKPVGTMCAVELT